MTGQDAKPVFKGRIRISMKIIQIRNIYWNYRPKFLKLETSFAESLFFLPAIFIKISEPAVTFKIDLMTKILAVNYVAAPVKKTATGTPPPQPTFRRIKDTIDEQK